MEFNSLIWKYFTDNDFTRLQEKQIKFTDEKICGVVNEPPNIEWNESYLYHLLHE